MKFRLLFKSLICGAVICISALSTTAATPVVTPALPAPVQPVPPPVITLSEKTYVNCPIVEGLCNGQISNVTNGTIDIFSLVPVDDKNLVVNFGYGTVLSRENIGELFSFAGRNYIREVAPDATVRLLSTYQTIRTPLSVGLYSSSVISPRVFRVEYSTPVLLQALMNKAVQDIKEPVMALGWVEMPEMNGEALKKAPIDGVSLNGDRRSEYIESVSGKNMRVIFAALAVPAKAIQSITTALYLDKIFSISPTLKKDIEQPNIVIFAKAAITEDQIPDYYNTSPLMLTKLNSANVKDICTLLPTSTISKGIIMFYQPKLKGLVPMKKR